MRRALTVCLLFAAAANHAEARQDPAARAALPGVRHPIAVIAHRAGAGIAPENTLAAIRNAIRLGVDYVELDVRATRDGALVLMHDSTVDRTTNGTGAVRDLTLRQIRDLDAGTKFHPRYRRERVPLFEEALRLCRGRVHIYVDHKEAPTAEVLRAIRAQKMEGSVVVYAGTEALREWKRLAPEIPVMPSLPTEYRVEGGVQRFLASHPADVLDGHLLQWNADLLRQAAAAGVPVYVDIMGPTDREEGYTRALELGVQGIQTDYPDRLLAMLKQRAGSDHSSARSR